MFRYICVYSYIHIHINIYSSSSSSKTSLCLVKTARIESCMLAKTTRHACNKYRSTCIS